MAAPDWPDASFQYQHCYNALYTFTIKCKKWAVDEFFVYDFCLPSPSPRKMILSELTSLSLCLLVRFQQVWCSDIFGVASASTSRFSRKRRGVELREREGLYAYFFDVDVLDASQLSVVSSVVLCFMVCCGFWWLCWFCHNSDSMFRLSSSFIPHLFL